MSCYFNSNINYVTWNIQIVHTGMVFLRQRSSGMFILQNMKWRYDIPSHTAPLRALVVAYNAIHYYTLVYRHIFVSIGNYNRLIWRKYSKAGRTAKEMVRESRIWHCSQLCTVSTTYTVGLLRKYFDRVNHHLHPPLKPQLKLTSRD